MMLKKTILLLSILLGIISNAVGQKILPTQLSDSTEISLLTTYPTGSQVYTVYGHSALRVHDMKQDVDAVFNYGLFDFDTPNFIYRFCAGETDYMVGAEPFDYYTAKYAYAQQGIAEQVLNLSDNEKQKIWAFLIENIKEENKVYRYNIFFDNCTTKLLDVIEQHADNKVLYPIEQNTKTFRNLLHEHLAPYKWLQFGIDLIIGADADRVMTVKEKMFLPIYLKNIYNETTILDTAGISKPLIKSDTDILTIPSDQKIDDKSFFTPLVVGIIILLLAIFSCLYTANNKSILGTGFHFLYFLVGGLTGCIIFFFMFFSVHPATSTNWNIVWLNPLLLIGAFLFFVKMPSKYVYYYHFLNFVILSLFLLVWFLIPQQLEISFAPYIMGFWAISGTQVLKNRRLKQQLKKSVKQ